MHIFRTARSVWRVSWIAVAVIVGCEDLPTTPDVASAPPSVGLSTEALAAMHALLDDPLIHDVIAQADHTSTDNPVQRTLQAVVDGIASGDRVAVISALTHAQRELGATSERDGGVHRAALSLTLDAVHTVLDDALNSDSAEAAVALRPTATTRRSR